MTDLDSVFEVERAICHVLHVSGPRIRAETRLVGDLGAESIDLIGLSSNLQKAVDADVDFRKLFCGRQARGGESRFDLTVRELADFVKTQVEKRTLMREQPLVEITRC